MQARVRDVKAQREAQEDPEELDKDSAPTVELLLAIKSTAETLSTTQDTSEERLLAEMDRTIEEVKRWRLNRTKKHEEAFIGAREEAGVDTGREEYKYPNGSGMDTSNAELLKLKLDEETSVKRERMRSLALDSRPPPYVANAPRRLPEDLIQRLLAGSPEVEAYTDADGEADFFQGLECGSRIESSDIKEALEAVENSALLGYTLESYSSGLDKLISRLDA